MSKVYVVGLGPGNIEYLTEKGRDAIKKAIYVIGGKRHIESIHNLNNNSYAIESISETVEYLNDQLNLNIFESIALVVSGDTGFYSLLDYLMKNIQVEFRDNIEVIPGISSVSYLFSCVKKLYSKFSLLSTHGRELDICKSLDLSDKGLALLTDSKNSYRVICEKLIENNYKDYTITVGANLSYPYEKIVEVDLLDYKSIDIDVKEQVVMIIERKDYAL